MAAGLVLRRIHPGIAGAERVLGWSILFTALLIAVHLVPAILTIMSRWTVAATALIVLAIALATTQRDRTRASARVMRSAARDGDEAGMSSWLLAALGVAIVAVYTLAYLRAQRTVAPSGVDMMSFHMPDVARWIQRATIWQAPELVPDWTQGHYPHNGEMVLLSAVLPWRNDAFVRFVYYPYLALLGLGVYGLARRLEAPRPLATLVGALAVAPPTVARSTLLSTKPDVILWATFAAGLVFLARHWATGRRADLALAGIGLGLAFGSKWYGLSAVVAVLIVWTVACLAARRPVEPGARQLLALSAWVLAAGGFWLARNAVLSGNPLFANKVALFGVTIFDAPPDPIKQTLGFSILHYAGHPRILRHFVLPPLWRAGRLSLVLAALGVTAASVVVIVMRRRGTRAPGLVLAAIAAAIALFGAYATTPFSAYGPRDAPDATLTFVSVRYGVPALIVGLAVAAWAAARLGPRLMVAIELVAVAAIAYGLRESVDVSAKDIVVTALACALLLGLARVATRLPRRHLPLAAAALLLVVVLAGYAQQRQLNKRRYMSDSVIGLVSKYAPGGYRIGVAGTPNLSDTIAVYPMFGPYLRNKVQWIGPLVRGVLRDWTTAAGFRGAVRRAGYDLIVIERGSPPRAEVKEQRWLAGTGYKAVATSRSLTLYRRG